MPHACLKKWTPWCAPVARSLEEAGLDLLTFYRFPKAMWKSLRTTNALEHLNREFRRRTKTHASFSTDAAAWTVLFGLVAVEQIVFRKIDGHQELAAFLVREPWLQAASGGKVSSRSAGASRQNAFLQDSGQSLARASATPEPGSESRATNTPKRRWRET